MKNTGWKDEQYQQLQAENREIERFEQAHEEYEAQLRIVPLRVDFDTDEDYEAALADWSDIVVELLARAKSLEWSK